MNPPRSDWKLTAWIFVAALATALVSLLLEGTGQAGTTLYLRNTGRLAAVIFAVAFSASALVTLFGDRLSWPARHRRNLGLGFAGVMAVHFVAIVALFFVREPQYTGITLPGNETSPWIMPVLVLLGGGAGLLIVLAMSITSFAAPRRRLGEQRWRHLHHLGGWFLLLIISVDTFDGLFREQRLIDIPFCLIVLAVVSLRASAHLASRQSILGPTTGTERASPQGSTDL
ncbi:MAG: ferric reductase-like transmembrane domain-containing protein [Thermoleophilaceae bacterium]|nr:ferric reductase-like transmembrane domain-containing protein [Thermoleophilaceae bacterium]